MSTQVDNRIVEMQFDNRHFEKNVSTTMSTLDKLKQKLHLKGATTGLENVNNAAKNVNMSGLGSAVQTVSAKFSALEVMGVTALANLTNSAVNAGKRIVSALTIDPVKTGLSEYETKINAIQVIKANTRAIYEGDEARQMQDIEDALADLNTYADRTIYNFAQMTDNVGKFVAQGLGVKEAAKAVEGMANLAGASGASAQDMARATYQMSQALGGTIRKIDWNSLRNANMASIELKNTLMDLARVEGIDIDAMIEEKGTFEDTLEKGWLSGELFTKAMNIYSDVYSEAELAAMGFNEAQIANFKDLAKTAREATTEVKTMSQLWDVLKETAQSGWTRTWELIIGDFADAKKMWTEVNNFFSDIINNMSDARNRALEIALDFTKPWTAITDKLSNIKKVAEEVGDVVGTLEYFQDVVNRVWRGDFNNRGDNPDRRDLLTAAGYDHRVVQDLVNKGYKYKLTYEDIEASHKKFGLTMATTAEETEAVAESLNKLSDAQLKDAGLTEEEIRLYRALEKEADRLGISVSDLADEMSNNKGRDMLIGSFKDVGGAIMDVAGAIKQAWIDIFNPPSTEEIGVRLYGIIRSLKSFTEKLRLTDDQSQKLQRTFKGLFALVDLVTTIFGGAFKIAFKVASAVLKYFNLDILDVTAYIGDALVKFRDFVEGLFDIGKVLGFIIPPIQKAVEAFRNWFAELKASGKIKQILSDVGDSIKSLFDKIPDDLISGFTGGIKDGIKTVGTAMLELGKAILAKFREVLGIHSPSTETKEDGKNFVLGFTSGIVQFIGKAVEAVIALALKCVDALKGADLGNLFAIGISAASIIGIFKISKALNGLIAPLEGFGDMCEEIGVGVKRVSKGLKRNLTAEAFKSFAIGIGILAASLLVVSLIDPDRLWPSIAALGAMAAIVGVLTFVMGKFVTGDTKGLAKMILSLIGISTAMLLLAGALKIINGLDVATVNGILLGIIGLLGVIGLIAKSEGGKNVGAFASVIAKLGVALLIMAIVMKIIGNMKPEELENGLVGLIGLLGLITLFITLLQFVSKGNSLNGVDKTLWSVAGVMLVMTIVAKMIAGMSWTEMAKGGAGVLALAAIIVGIVYFLKPLAKDQSLKGVGSTLFGVAAAMLVMALVVKILGGMEFGKAIQGAAAVGTLALYIVGMMYALKPLAKDQHLKGVGRTLVMMSVAIGILALITVLLGLVDPEILKKGLTAVTILGLLMSVMARSIRGINKGTTGALVVLAVTIAILVGATATLGLIDSTKLGKGVTALVAVLGMLSLVLAMAGKVQKVTGTMWAIVAMITILSAALYLLAQLPVENTIGAAGALSLMLIALSGALYILSMVGTTFSMALQGIMLLTAMVVPLLAFVGVLAVMSMVKNAEANAILLTGLMTTMTLLLIPLTMIGAVGILAAAGLATLTGVILAIGVLVTAIGALMTKFPQIEEFVDKGLGVLEKLGLGIGRVIGNIIKGFVQSAAQSLPILGASLSAFMMLAMPFIVGVKMVDSDVLTGTANLAAAIALLGVADLIAMITTLGGVGLPALGGSLSGFWNEGKDFFEGIKGVDATALEGVKALAQAILVLTAADVIDSLTSWFTGGNSLTEFGKELAEFGPYMKQYSDAVTGIDTEAVKVSADAAKSLAEMAKELPNSGGLLGKIMGDNDMDDFGTQLKGFGESLMAYGKSVDGIEAYTDGITASVEASKGLVDLAENIPNSGGFLADFLGDNTMDGFGSQLKGFGESLLAYGKSVEGIADYAESIKTSAEAASYLTELADNIPNSGGFLGEFLGDNTMDDFGTQLKGFGESLKTYGDSVNGINVDGINASVSAAEGLAGVAKAAKDIGKWDVGKSEFVKFGENMASFGTSMKNYNAEVAGINTTMLSLTTKEFSALSDLAAKMSTTDSSGFGTFAESLAKLGADGVNDFINAFNGSVIKVRTAVNNFIATAASTITLGRPNIVTAVNTLINAASAALDVGYDAFYEAGYNFVRGFANGITANSYIASIAARTMAARAITAAKIELDEHSPSRVGYGIGDYFGIAFVNGIADNVKKAYSSSKELAKSAKTGLSDAIGRISDAINSDIDTQPTIRPVLDLSNVKAGAGTIGSLFGDSPVGVMANVGSISAGMRRYNQNGSNDDIVSAIGDLKKALGNGGDTYQINGITYDDGSNIADAVQSLVRAAKVGRRV